MKSMGKGIVEFKKGIKGVEDDVEDAAEKLETPKSRNDKIETDNKEHINNEMKG
jgi:sec-independent protein translocase protein TatA